jgi:hypothetical protein
MCWLFLNLLRQTGACEMVHGVVLIWSVSTGTGAADKTPVGAAPKVLSLCADPRLIVGVAAWAPEVLATEPAAAAGAIVASRPTHLGIIAPRSGSWSAYLPTASNRRLRSRTSGSAFFSFGHSART